MMSCREHTTVVGVIVCFRTFCLLLYGYGTLSLQFSIILCSTYHTSPTVHRTTTYGTLRNVPMSRRLERVSTVKTSGWWRALSLQRRLNRRYTCTVPTPTYGSTVRRRTVVCEVWRRVLSLPNPQRKYRHVTMFVCSVSLNSPKSTPTYVLILLL